MHKQQRLARTLVKIVIAQRAEGEVVGGEGIERLPGND
jgi:hypothetical protein